MSVHCSKPFDKAANFVVIGGGIAGVTCTETLSALAPENNVILITASSLIKAVTNFQQLSKALESFDVTEKPSSSLTHECWNVEVLQASVTRINCEQHILETDVGIKIKYDKLCICTGGKPKLICEANPYVIGIRDTETVQTFQQKLSGARRIVVVGNGGIATEIVYEVEGCEVIWAIKDDSISTMYLDPGAAQFILPKLGESKTPREGPLKRLKYTVSGSADKTEHCTPGGALGPDWAEKVSLKGNTQEKTLDVHVEYKVEVKNIWTAADFRETSHNSSDVGEWPVYVELTNGGIYGCDVVVSATGVLPNTDPFLEMNQFTLGSDGGLKVNHHMETSVKDVFAAGDVCTPGWDLSPLWQQMRLWSQARQMGAYSAKCMVADHQGETIHMDFCFELFAHVTKFFNYKVVLLGKYNAHGLGNDYHILLRMTKGKEYVKTVMHNGKMVGAILIGETDLEETFENLILNQMDLSSFGEDLLHPGVDIEDFFD